MENTVNLLREYPLVPEPQNHTVAHKVCRFSQTDLRKRPVPVLPHAIISRPTVVVHGKEWNKGSTTFEGWALMLFGSLQSFPVGHYYLCDTSLALTFLSQILMGVIMDIGQRIFTLSMATMVPPPISPR